jgi:hypothetical protein
VSSTTHPIAKYYVHQGETNLIGSSNRQFESTISRRIIGYFANATNELEDPTQSIVDNNGECSLLLDLIHFMINIIFH